MRLSQTYTAAIASFIGLLFTAAGTFGIALPFTSEEATLVIGLALDLAGTIWVIVHRYGKGDINIGGMKE